jgi:hypothetical protein
MLPGVSHKPPDGLSAPGTAQSALGLREQVGVPHAPPVIWVADEQSQGFANDGGAEAKPARSIAGPMFGNAHVPDAVCAGAQAQARFCAPQETHGTSQMRGGASGVRPRGYVNTFSPQLRMDIQQQVSPANANAVRPNRAASSLQLHALRCQCQ